MTLTIKLDGNWSSFQLANSAPPLSVTDSALAPSARMGGNVPKMGTHMTQKLTGTAWFKHSLHLIQNFWQDCHNICISLVQQLYTLLLQSKANAKTKSKKHLNNFVQIWFEEGLHLYEFSQMCVIFYVSCCWQSLASRLPLKKFCYGWLHRRLLRRYRPQSAVNCSTLWERAAGSPPNTSQVSLQICMVRHNDTKLLT